MIDGEFPKKIYQNRICENENQFDVNKVNVALKKLGFSPNPDDYLEILKK